MSVNYYTFVLDNQLIFELFDIMLFSKLSVLAVAVSAGQALAQAQGQDQAAQGQAQGGAAAGGDVLNAANIQSASDKTGQETGTDGIKPGQAPSTT